jgi:hypothetical protein
MTSGLLSKDSAMSGGTYADMKDFLARYLCNAIRVSSIGSRMSRHSCAAAYFDGVVESPIYCVAAGFQKLGILLVLPRPRKTTAHFYPADF